jgi:AraC-like DNA-binding protein
MKIDVNELICRYTNTIMEVKGAYEVKIAVNTKSTGGRTMEGLCGFIIPIKGKARFTICGQVYDLEPGVIFHGGSSMPLDKEVLGNSEWEYALIHYRVIESQGDKFFFENLHFSLNIGLNCYSELVSLVRQLHQSVKNPRITGELKSKALFYTLLEVIFQHAKNTVYTTEEKLIDAVTKYIDDNYDRNFTVSDLALMHDIDSKHFYYIFQKSLGMCPKQYIMKCRINNAKDLLINESYSISEIANLVGYEDAFHFSRMFKKNTGLSPKLFREEFGKNP